LPAYRPVAEKPDHPQLEHRILDLWQADDTFEKLRAQNAGGEAFSFIDGPITANNPMGVHHAWGRSLKDLFQRYRAAQGYELRYQNGFDCQGLWVEVEVEKALGLNSKREIEEFGLERFARACRDRVAEYAGVQTRQSMRLGQWMDWERSYYTFTDPNITYIWRFLQECDRNGWLYTGHRPMVWCPRCGTSLSQHELIDSYREITHPSLTVLFELTDVEGEAIAIWTTTPWTLPANVAAAVQPDALYVGVEAGPGITWVVSERREAIFGEQARVVETRRGRDLVGRPYRAPFDDLPAQAGVEHRIVAWEDVGVEEGTGIVHIAPGCGEEDFELGRREGLPVITPVDESGAFLDSYGWLHGMHTGEAAPRIVRHLTDYGRLLREDTITHRYPVCWRCATELIFRVADEWFIKAEGVRQRMIDANRTVRWVPEFYGKRMEDWLRNMGDWCISRKRYWGLPLPFYRAPSGKVTVIGSVEELRERAVDPLDGLEELHRPWIDAIRIRTDDGEIAERVPEVGDAWLDAGIVPFSTLGWGRDAFEPAGYARGAGEGLTRADLPDHAHWERWFPADWVSEMREQIRLWFYSQLFMSVVLVDRAPYRTVLGYEKVHDETGRPMHKSWGNAIWFDDAVEHMGADVMRWLYASQAPSQNMNFGYGPANDVKRRLLTLWNSYGFLVRYASIDGFEPRYADLVEGPPTATALDRWLVARVQELVADVRAALDAYATPPYTRAVEAFVDDLSNWYIRGSRARYWKSANDDDKLAAFRTLWYALVQTTRLIAPAMPFLAEELWQTLVREVCPDAPESVHLAGFPEVSPALEDADLVAALADVQAVVRLGRAARSQSGAKLRQPLAEAVVVAAEPERRARIEAHAAEVAAELNVKRVEVLERADQLVTVRVIPNFRALGPRLGRALPEVKRLLDRGEYRVENGSVHVGEWTLGAGEFERRTEAREGFENAEEGPFVVAVDTRLTPELADEGIARDLIRVVQNGRIEAGFEITDRIRITYHANERGRRVLERFGEHLAAETLAVDLSPGDVGDGLAFRADDAEVALAIERA
jgi:isoleucyl-tRNA synthetase